MFRNHKIRNRFIFHFVSFVIMIMFFSNSTADSGSADLLFLSTPAFPEQMSMGPADFTLAGGCQAVFGNPSMIGEGLAFSGGRWLLETTTVSAAAGFRIMQDLRLGIGLRYFGRGGLEGTDEQGNPTGEFSFSSGIFGSGFSFQPFGDWRAGMFFGIAWEKIGNTGGTGFTFSTGISGHVGNYLELGVSITNLGKSPSWNSIHKDMPAELSAGAAFSFTDDIKAFGAYKLGFSTVNRFGGGMEFSVTGLKISGGYQFAPDHQEAGGIFSGILYRIDTEEESYSISFAMQQKDELNWPLIAGLSILF
jgi:hypothetical protein